MDGTCLFESSPCDFHCGSESLNRLAVTKVLVETGQSFFEPNMSTGVSRIWFSQRLAILIILLVVYLLLTSIDTNVLLRIFAWSSGPYTQHTLHSKLSQQAPRQDNHAQTFAHDKSGMCMTVPCLLRTDPLRQDPVQPGPRHEGQGDHRSREGGTPLWTVPDGSHQLRKPGHGRTHR